MTSKGNGQVTKHVGGATLLQIKSHHIIRFGGSRSCGFFVELEAKCCGVIRKE
jgi:hypothetical protein